jgi:hypothetical protein
MRNTLLACTIVLAAAAALFAARPQAARASCAAVIVWHDTAYFGSAASGPHPLPGPRVRGAVEPGCNDTGGGAGSPSSVSARSTAGVPPQVALLSGGLIYVPAGEFPQLRGFPIRSGHVDDMTRTCRVTAHVTAFGHALPGAGEVDLADVRASRPLRLFDHRLSVLVDVHTRVRGLDRYGVPYIGQRQAVRIAAVRCGHMIVARSIVPGGPIAPVATAEDVLGTHWRGDGGLLHQLGGTARAIGALTVVAILVLVVLGLRAGGRGSPAGTG